jgi:hypothetical protein
VSVLGRTVIVYEGDVTPLGDGEVRISPRLAGEILAVWVELRTDNSEDAALPAASPASDS